LKKITICVGTRPNFIKVTQFEKYLSNRSDVTFELVHTGQHFDHNMSEVFFNELQLKKPDVYLDAKGNTQIEMMADIMCKFEAYLHESKPDLVLVPGDVNSSLACAIATSRNGIKLGHLESGLRSFDRAMPEEINRILIDDLSDLFFVTEQSGIDNLLAENKSKDAIHFVGNTMIDSLVAFQDKIDERTILNEMTDVSSYAMLTFHRPSNVDTVDQLKKLTDILLQISKQIHLVFSVHPRTMKNLKKFNLLSSLEENTDITLLNSLGYLDFIHLVKNARFVLTDSGGIQEETSYMNVPCLTVRENTERPVTIEVGTNSLVPLDVSVIEQEVQKIMNTSKVDPVSIPLWDGNATGRIVDVITSNSSVES
jgi:UDP-N-acetylglucosamine 2-epimerase (non-hydrolysing)